MISTKNYNQSEISDQTEHLIQEQTEYIKPDMLLNKTLGIITTCFSKIVSVGNSYYSHTARIFHVCFVTFFFLVIIVIFCGVKILNKKSGRE